jgi:hypothetical protein
LEKKSLPNNVPIEILKREFTKGFDIANMAAPFHVV